MRVQTLGWGETLEQGMATHSSTCAWRIPWTEEPGRQQSRGSSGKSEAQMKWLSMYVHLSVQLKKKIASLVGMIYL